MDMSSAGLDYDPDTDSFVSNGEDISQTSYAQFVDAQGGNTTDPDGHVEEEEDDEEGDEEEEEPETEFTKK